MPTIKNKKILSKSIKNKSRNNRRNITRKQIGCCYCNNKRMKGGKQKGGGILSSLNPSNYDYSFENIANSRIPNVTDHPFLNPGKYSNPIV
jgi:hypothetical protein